MQRNMADSAHFRILLDLLSLDPHCKFATIRPMPTENSAPLSKKTLTPHGKSSQHARRNAGAISLVLAAVEKSLIEAVNTDGFHGHLDLKVDIVDQDVTMLQAPLTQRIKLK